MSKLALALTLSLFSVAMASQHARPTVQQMQEATPLISKSGQVPIVQMFGYEKSLVTNGWGVNLQFGVDLNLGYNLPVQHLSLMGVDNLMLNPQIYAEVASHNFIELSTPIV